MRKIAITLIVAGATFATSAGAQVIVRANAVPPGQRPPDGMCRVWIEGVAAGRQPAATDCATAQATAPLNSRIIVGANAAFPGRATGRFRDGDCEFERRRSNLGDVLFPRDSRDRDRDCRVSSSRSRENGVWYAVGRDSNGNVIYERRVRDRNGRTVTERARSRDGRTLTRIAFNGRVRMDRDRDHDDDDDDDRRMTRAERERERMIRDREKAVRNQQRAIEKARRDREKALRKAQRDREKAIERARRRDRDRRDG